MPVLPCSTDQSVTRRSITRRGAFRRPRRSTPGTLPSTRSPCLTALSLRQEQVVAAPARTRKPKPLSLGSPRRESIHALAGAKPPRRSAALATRSIALSAFPSLEASARSTQLLRLASSSIAVAGGHTCRTSHAAGARLFITCASRAAADRAPTGRVEIQAGRGRGRVSTRPAGLRRARRRHASARHRQQPGACCCFLRWIGLVGAEPRVGPPCRCLAPASFAGLLGVWSARWYLAR